MFYFETLNIIYTDVIYRKCCTLNQLKTVWREYTPPKLINNFINYILQLVPRRDVGTCSINFGAPESARRGSNVPEDNGKVLTKSREKVSPGYRQPLEFPEVNSSHREILNTKMIDEKQSCVLISTPDVGKNIVQLGGG